MKQSAKSLKTANGHDVVFGGNSVGITIKPIKFITGHSRKNDGIGVPS
jgi:hypothetical protein